MFAQLVAAVEVVPEELFLVEPQAAASSDEQQRERQVAELPHAATPVNCGITSLP